MHKFTYKCISLITKTITCKLKINCNKKITYSFKIFISYLPVSKKLHINESIVIVFFILFYANLIFIVFEKIV